MYNMFKRCIFLIKKKNIGVVVLYKVFDRDMLV